MQRSTGDGPWQASLHQVSVRREAGRDGTDDRGDDQPDLDRAMARQVNGREMACADRETL
jgi:hypothetical protein